MRRSGLLWLWRYAWIWTVCAACRTTWAAEIDLPALPERIQMGIAEANGKHAIGASFASPEGPGWRLTRRAGTVELFKPGAAAGTNWQIEAYLVRVSAPGKTPEQRAAVIRKDIVEGIERSDRWKLAALEVNPEASDLRCVRIHLLLQGQGSSAVSADRSSATSEQYVRNCEFFTAKGWGVELRYYQRGFTAAEASAFADQAAKLLDSLALEDR